MKTIQAPHPLHIEGTSIFLAGSIEMGAAEKWQDKLTASLSDLQGTIMNPRRDDWDYTWVQEATNPQFRQQVLWELDAIEAADIVAFYFDPNTKSPITLLELGTRCWTSQRVIVCCPAGFWRKGNVDLVCERYAFKQVESLEELTNEVRESILSILT